ncbi:DUF6173 family protein [Jannaschia marina]|uniref:DUF6173 family protein n=1 Tax=Jannaschia marina TaxID=2741674 RepID=UPI0015CE7F81|nr:DUF6173 family protein [Jannaschia marina]
MNSQHTTAEAMESAALDRCADLRADGRDHAVPVPPKVAARADKSPAEWAFQRVILHLKAFEEALSDGEVAAMAFAGGPSGVLRIQGVGFHAPDLVTFSGVDDDGLPVQAIQHVSQLNVLLRAVPKPADDPTPERIGFRLARALEETAEAADTLAQPDAPATS